MAVQQVKSQIVELTGKHVDILYIKWSRMFEPNPCIELMQKLEDRVNEFYNDLHKESEEQEQLILDDIGEIEAEIEDVSRQLQRNVDVRERPEEMPLVKWHQTLDNSFEDLREALQERRAAIGELLLQQEQLREQLGELPLSLIADPLPNAEEMSSFREHLERLRVERKRRMDELFKLRREINKDMKMLELGTQSEADEHLLNQANQCLTPNVFKNLSLMKEELGAQVGEQRAHIDDMRQKINVLWERQQDKAADEFAMRRVHEAKTYTQRTHDILWQELQRCQKLRSQNLKNFIDQLRVEIAKWWEMILKSKQEKKRFANYDYNECYNEDLLELHELELAGLKSFYNTNKEIFELFGSRAKLWAQMEALEEKANDPHRFNNRGGRLLKEERERKAMGSKLPKIEQQIRELVDKYELHNHTPFLVHGENILEHMDSDWMRLRQAKKQHSTTCSSTPILTIKNANGSMPLPPTAGSIAKRAPLVPRNISATPSSTMQKKKLVNAAKVDTPVAKRFPLNKLRSKRTPLKKVHVLETTLQHSSGSKRRSKRHGCKKVYSKLQMPAIRLSTPTGDSDEYVTDDNGRA